MYARQTHSSSVSYLTSATRNLVLNRTYCLSFYYYVAVPHHLPSSVSLHVYVTPDQVQLVATDCCATDLVTPLRLNH